ncbi:hypothetical protein RvY_11933 [Ramazzottius varieornatus]|uniref:Uncharacterized protein n=1 Tax=Ramazzottius varieornatus TaxID=947166 RepID=A0A1D1VQG0_RAMVA|nr:hypothetical protein RvY_11933 [Ramazzottius varieornatus]
MYITPGDSESAQIRYVKEASLGSRDTATLKAISVRVTNPVVLPLSSLPQIWVFLAFLPSGSFVFGTVTTVHY